MLPANADAAGRLWAKAHPQGVYAKNLPRMAQLICTATGAGTIYQP